MNHTGEPWYTRETVDEMNIHGEGGSFIVSTFGRDNPDKEKADAERIVASVNFLTGIPTHQIEDIASEGMSLLDLMASVKDWDVAHLRAYLLGEEP